MAHNLVRLWLLESDEKYKDLSERQLAFIAAYASQNPISYTMFLIALLDYTDAPIKITVVTDQKTDISSLPCSVPLNSIVKVLFEPTQVISMKNNRTTYYICQGHTCKSPVNDLNEFLGH